MGWEDEMYSAPGAYGAGQTDPGQTDPGYIDPGYVEQDATAAYDTGEDDMFSAASMAVFDSIFNSAEYQAPAGNADTAIAPETSGAETDGKANVKDGWLDKLLYSVKNDINWKSDKVQVAAMTIGAGAIAGIGKGIADKEKMKLEERKINTAEMLAKSQADIAAQRAQNQNFSNFQFNAPTDAAGQPVGLINRAARARLTPVTKRVLR